MGAMARLRIFVVQEPVVAASCLIAGFVLYCDLTSRMQANCMLFIKRVAKFTRNSLWTSEEPAIRQYRTREYTVLIVFFFQPLSGPSWIHLRLPNKFPQPAPTDMIAVVTVKK